MKQNTATRPIGEAKAEQTSAPKNRFLLINAFSLPDDSPYLHRPVTRPKEKRLMNFEQIGHLLDEVEWEVHPWPMAAYGDWPVENREEQSEKYLDLVNKLAGS